jgi:hypothetical protein
MYMKGPYQPDGRVCFAHGIPAPDISVGEECNILVLKRPIENVNLALVGICNVCTQGRSLDHQICYATDPDASLKFLRDFC